MVVLHDDGGQLLEVRQFRIASCLDIDAPLALAVLPHLLRCGEYGPFAQSVCEHRRELWNVPARVRRCSLAAA